MFYENIKLRSAKSIRYSLFKLMSIKCLGTTNPFFPTGFSFKIFSIRYFKLETYD